MPVRKVQNIVHNSLTGEAHWPAFASAALFGGIFSFVLALAVGFFGEQVEPMLAPEPSLTKASPLQTEPIHDVAPETNQTQQRELILDDYQARVSKGFAVPAGLRDRVGFWYDIYTRYGYHERVIHHARYPWIVFKVIDVADILNASTPRARWLREMRASAYVDAELRGVREALWKLAKRKGYDDLSSLETQIFDKLQTLPGQMNGKAKMALSEVRIQTGQRDFFLQGIELGNRYIPRMEEIFKSHNLPVELVRLPLVESSFNRAATSKAGASGVWQFINVTGKKYMLITDDIDERRSPFKSTEAAARLLKENYQILYKNWALAITAYNHGPGGVRRAVKKFGSQDIVKLSNHHQTRSYDFASQNYYSEFLAALYAQMYAEQIWENINPEESLQVVWYSLPRRVRPAEIMKVLGMVSEDFIFYNPDTKKAVQRNAWLPRGFKISLPNRLVSELERELQELRFKRAG